MLPKSYRKGAQTKMTIKELATELNLSKVSVNKRIDELGLKDKLIKQGNRYDVPVEVAEQVRESYSAKPKTESKKESKADVIEILNNQLQEKDRQIQSLMNQLEKLQEQNGQLLQTVQQGNYLLAGAIGVTDSEPIEAENAIDPNENEAPAKKKGFFSRLFG